MSRVYWSLTLVCIVALNSKIEARATNDGPISHHPGLSISPRIMGGQDAQADEAPYQCSLQKKSKHFCGCAIISSNWIITAAHCLLGERPRDVEVLVGTNSLSSGGMRYSANKTFIHENYTRSNYAYDIALLRVQTPIEFNEKVQPIKISSKVIEPGTQNLKITGWGILSKPDGENPDNLQVLYVKSISNDECARSFDCVHVSHLCTVGEYGQGIGSGDSGGPIARNNDLVGISSFADPSEIGLPSGFARISYLYEWIEKKTRMPQLNFFEKKKSR